MQICKDCAFFAMRSAADNVGECRKAPPIGFPVPTQFGVKFQGAWPPVQFYSGCAQGEPRPAETPVHVDSLLEEQNGKQVGRILA